MGTTQALVGRRRFIVSACAAAAVTRSVAWGRETKPIRVGFQPNLGGARYFVALGTGIFARNGLDVRPVEFSVGSKYFAAFLSGSIDVGWLGTPPTGTAIAQGIPIRVFAVEALARDQEGLVVRPGSAIRSVRDLKGKRIATKRGSSGDVALQSALRKAGLSAVDVNLVDLDVHQLLAAFNAAEVDGGWYWEPWQGRMREAGGLQIATDRDCGALIGWTWSARRGWLERNHAATQSLLRSLDEAAAFMRLRPDDAAAVCARELGISVALAHRVITREGEWPTMAESWASGYPESLNPRAVRAGAGAVVALRVNAYAAGIESKAARSAVAAAIDTRPLAAYVSGHR